MFHLNVSGIYECQGPSKYKSWVKLLSSTVVDFFLHYFIIRTLFLRGWWNPSGQLASHSFIWALPRSIAFTSAVHTYMSRNDVHKMACCIQGIYTSLQKKFPLMTCLSFSLYLSCDASSSLWVVISTDEESFKSATSFINMLQMYRLVVHLWTAFSFSVIPMSPPGPCLFWRAWSCSCSCHDNMPLLHVDHWLHLVILLQPDLPQYLSVYCRFQVLNLWRIIQYQD